MDDDLMPDEFRVPSGAIYGDREIEILRLMHEAKSIVWRDEPFTFRSGIKSHIYVFLRDDFTQSPGLQTAVGKYLVERIAEIREEYFEKDGRIPCLIGVPTAGTPFASAVSIASDHILSPFPIHWRQMREIKKVAHGASHGWTNLPPDEEHNFMTIEQLTSFGDSLLKMIRRLEEDAYPGKDMHHVVFTDWELGGPELLRENGYQHVHSFFKMRDAAHVYRNILDLWTDREFNEVHRVINVHRK